MYKPKVYLSGGLKSNWQQRVIEKLGNKFIFFNPIDHELNNSDEYTTWDIHFLKGCDIIFAYMEKENPAGYGLAFEIGIAYALNKTIILVDEKSNIDEQFARWNKIIHKSAGVIYTDLNDGIEYLKKFSRIIDVE